MKEVKIYTIVSDQLSPPITGESFCTDMVRHSDYAELEDKYAALAADNDKAMESLKQADAVVKLAHEKFSALASENAALKKSEVEFNEYCRRECEDVGDTWVDDFTETQATDAFLAEVRAQGVERYAAQDDHINQQQDRIAELDQRLIEYAGIATREARRVAELEARTVTPPKNNVANVGDSRWMWCQRDLMWIEAIRAAGIKVIEGEGQ